MKDFAKSIVCNTKAENKKSGNSKVGNYTPNYRYKGFLITNPEGYEFVVFLQDGLHVGYRGTTSKAQAEDWCDWHDPKTGKPVAKFRNSKTVNNKVGNADIYSGNYIIMGDDGDVWFRDEHEDVSIKSIDSWAQKKIAEYQRSIDEIKKGVQEAKQQAKKFGLI